MNPDDHRGLFSRALRRTDPDHGATLEAEEERSDQSDAAVEELKPGSSVSWQCGSSDHDFVAVSVDHCVRLGSEGVCVTGWLLETDDQVDALRVGHVDTDGIDPRTSG